MPSSSAPPRHHLNAPRQHARINLTDIKARISKRLGPDKSSRYFSFLNRFFSNKIGKNELNKQCIVLFGHESIQLHNQLIKSILKNSILSKTPPPQNPQNQKPQIKSSNLTSNLPASWCNGGILPISPRKIRTGLRERKLKDPILPLNGQTGLDPNPNSNQIKENGAIRISSDQQQGPIPIHNFSETEDQTANITFTKRPLIEAPIGVPFCRASTGGAQFHPFNGTTSNAGTSTSIGTNNGTNTFTSKGELFDTNSLKARMENIVKAQGLEGISPDCAEILNKSLDLYLKRLIGSVTSLTGSVRSQNPNQNQNLITLEDFTIAMQLNPKLLGENSSEQVERMSCRLFEQKDEKDRRNS
ncbi:hypothetical protein LUZ60_017241 [Juncus effusus]|nr:hypothetical protein LUZ60_017241 [Juncus effusus]